jgi:hypothetical protein
VVQMAMLVLRLVLDLDLGRSEAALFDFARHESAAWQAERIDGRLYFCQGRARIDQRAERHIAADSASTIEVSNPHGH